MNMLEIEKVIKNQKKKIEASLRNSYATAYKNPKFKALINNLKVKEDIAIKYTSKLEETVEELTNCDGCKNLLCCKNKIEGYVYFPVFKNDKLIFSYKACKYMKKHLKTIEQTENNDEISNASMKDIDITDKKRAKVIKWLKDFYDKYDKNKKIKGLYLHGNFGSGKTYLVAALLNELTKKRVRTQIVYFPELIREIKGDFDSYADKMEYYMDVDILFLDDIGAEKVTEWSRDEVLGTILQNRMNNSLPTFFTSNLTIEELERHLVIGNGSEDQVKARRIIERIKQMTEQHELISENRRK